jgi:GNAT superfamily N-acetyltransferase
MTAPHATQFGPELSPSTAAVVHVASDERDWHDARTLILQHISWICASLEIGDPYAVQPGLRDELASLPGYYAEPYGRLFIARVDGAPAGTVGIAVDADGVLELKRLYVRPEARGLRLGERLVRAALGGSADLGHRRIRLQTKPGLMDAAIAIYRRLGFRETDPYGDLTLDDVLHMEMSIPHAARQGAIALRRERVHDVR